MKRRDIALCIILTIVTCGLYSIYWMIMLNDEINTLADRPGLSGGIVLLCMLVTCGIYELVWSYQMGQAVESIHARNGQPESRASLVYLVLSIFGLGIVSYALMQNELNQYLQ